MMSISPNGMRIPALLLFILLFITSSFQLANSAEIPSLTTRYEYAIFYMETEGEFIIPVSSDAPEIYSWSEPKGSIKGDILQIWNFLGITKEVEYSFTEIEASILNHVASEGWQLQDLEVSSVQLMTSEMSIRSAYRYIFKRIARNRAKTVQSAYSL